MRTFITAVVVTLAVPAGAVAMPPSAPLTSGGADLRTQAPHSSPVVQLSPSAAVTDLSGPDRGTRPTVPSRLPTRGTDVAAPDQQAPTDAPVSHVNVLARAHHFDWGDAAIGAGAIMAVLTVGGILVLLGSHRRRSTRQIASIG